MRKKIGPIASRVILLALFLTAAVPAWAQRGDRLATNRMRDGKDVKTAYTSIVASADQATVRVLCGGKEAALGTVVDASGLVLTKYSELRDPVTCRLADGRTVTAKVIGHLPQFDLAMLKLEAEKLKTAPWAEGTIEPDVGEFVATAAPGDLPRALGVVSVPRHAVLPRSGVLGIQLEHADDSAKVTLVFPGSGAEEAGLKAGDIVTRVGDKAVETRQVLIETIRQYKPGDALVLSIKRGDKEMPITVTLSTPGRIGSRSAVMNSMGGPLSRRAADFPAVIQHDTALRSVDCGGPLTDLSGNVIGINIARAGRTESYALPADTVLPLLADLKSGKLAPKNALPKASE
jgi:serine protease Do